MRRRTEGLVWSLFAATAAGLAGMIAHKALETMWKQARRKDPPLNPAAPSVTWTEALVWGIAAGAVAGLSRVVARRGAVVAWKRLIGEPPSLNT